MQVTGDVTRFAEIEAMRQQIEGTFGPVDILVANAGASLAILGPLEKITEEGWLESGRHQDNLSILMPAR